MALWYYLQVRTPEMNLDVLKCYLRGYITDDSAGFWDSAYRCPETGSNEPFQDCSHSRLVEASERQVSIGQYGIFLDGVPCDCRPEDLEDQEEECIHWRNYPGDPVGLIVDAVIEHSGTLPGIAKLDEALARRIRHATSPATGYPEIGFPFSRQQIERFLAENMGAMVFVDLR